MDANDPETVERMFDNHVPSILWFDKDFDKKSPEYEIFVEVAKKYKGQAAFVLVQTTEGSGEEFAEYFGIQDKSILGIVSQDEEEIDKYLFAENLSEDNLSKWVKKFLNQELERHLMSEPIPEKNDGPVKVVVGNNFLQVAQDPEKHVLVEIYAPWCQHCQKVILTFHTRFN